MNSFMTTNGKGQFVLDGKPWYYHGATYYGPGPHYWGDGSWIGKDFEQALALAPDDMARMKDLGLNALGLFIPGASFFKELEPDEAMFSRLDRIIDAVADAGMRAVVFPVTHIDRIPKEIWCKARGVEPGEELWNSAINEEAAQSQIYTITHFARRYSERPEVLGYMGRVGRFDFKGFDPPEAMASPVHSVWHRWLRERFKDDFSLARELLELAPDETDWATIRMPAEMSAGFGRQNPRAFEYGVMQHVLINRGNARLNKAVKEAAPKQLTVTDVEGVEIPIGLINVLVPELATADVLWVECYHWEGMRGTQVTETRHQTWLVEPNAGGKRAVDLVGQAGYVQMLVRWMQQSGKAIIICHGVEVGEASREKHSEYDQALMFDRFNGYIEACGAHGIDYWYYGSPVRGREHQAPVPAADFVPPGNSMSLLRDDGSERPVCSIVRSTGRSLAGKPPAESSHETLVLFPTPIFQSLFRYRANVTGFGIFTSLARQGILADAAFTSAGEDLITPDRLTPYRLIILGMPQYHRDHPEIPGLLQRYVEQGGTLFLPLADPEQLDDPYIKPRALPALRTLAGVKKLLDRKLRPTLRTIASCHRSFVADATPSWTLEEDGWFTRVQPVTGAEILAEADGDPLLYRHAVGKGRVYVFTWTLDVLLFRGKQLDYLGGHWDWLWQGMAEELGLTQDVFNPASRIIRDMTYVRTQTQ